MKHFTRIKSYDHAMSYFPSTREVTRVKPTRRFTLHREKLDKRRGEPRRWGNIAVNSFGRTWATITPDNMVSINPTASSRRLIEVFGIYKTMHDGRWYIVPCDKFIWRDRNSAARRAKWPHLQPDNMRFNLTTQTFCDEKYDAQYEVHDVDANARWRRQLTTFGRSLRVHARLGCFTQATVDQIPPQATPPKHEQLELFVAAVQGGDVLKILPVLYPPGWWHRTNPINDMAVVREFNSFYNRHRTEIRVLVGALKEREDDGHNPAISVEADGSNSDSAA